MSGVAGVFRRDGNPAGADDLSLLLEHLSHRGSHHVGRWAGSSTSLGHAAPLPAATSNGAPQPWADASNEVVVTFDGWLAAKPELLDALLSEGAQPRLEADVELVLQSYLVWGEASVNHLLGDFAFAVWDGRRKTVFCARDPVGIRPLYFYLDSDLFCFSSELRGLLELPAVSEEPNEGFIGEILAGEIVSLRDTVYREISRLEPANYLLVSRDTSSFMRYWRPESVAPLEYARDADYAAHIRQTLETASRDSIAACDGFGVSLSGGLDSSAVAGLVRALPEHATKRLSTYSWVFPGLPQDESSYLQDVIEFLSLENRSASPLDYEVPSYEEHVRHYRDFPEFPNLLLRQQLHEMARGDSCTVLLTGEGGDDWFEGNELAYADLLASRNLGELARRACTEAGGSSLTAARLVARYGLTPWVRRGTPRWAIAPARTLLGKGPRVPRWVSPEFARRVDLEDRLRSRPQTGRWETLEREAIFTRGLGFHTYLLEQLERVAARDGLEYRHPMHDRRVVELGLSLPPSQRWDGGELGRLALRRAVEGVVPERVRTRVSKGDFSILFSHVFNATGSWSLLEAQHLEARGWVDGERLRGMASSLRAFDAYRDEYAEHTWPVWCALGLEMWLRWSDS